VLPEPASVATPAGRRSSTARLLHPQMRMMGGVEATIGARVYRVEEAEGELEQAVVV
jgi:hypothetical protein